MQRQNHFAIFSLYIVLFVLACTAAIAPMFSFHFPGISIGEHLYHVQAFMAGRIPYRDFFVSEYSAYLFPLSLYFLIFPIDSFSVWLLAVILHAATSLGIACSVLLITRSWKMSTLALLTAGTAGWCWNWNGHGLYPQAVYLPLFSWWIASICAGIKAKSSDFWYVAAFLLGLMLLFDPLLAVFFLPALITLLVSGKKRNSLPLPLTLMVVLLLCLLPGCLFLLWLEQKGALSDFFFQTYFYPMNYLVSIRESVWWRFIAWGPYGEPLLSLCGYMGLLGLLRRPSLPLRYFFLSLLVTCFVYLYLADLPGPHYLLLFIPPLIVCAIVGYWQIRQDSTLLSYLVLIPLFVLIGGAVIRPLMIWQATLSPYIPADERAFYEAAHQIKERAGENDELFVIGPASLYVMTKKLSPFKDASLVTVTGASSQSTELSHGIVSEMALSFQTFLEKTPPTFIVYYYVHETRCNSLSIYCRYSFFDSSKRSLQYNRDFRQAVALTYLRDKISSDYKKVAAAEWERDGFELYQLIEHVEE